MEIRELAIGGAWEFTPVQHGDSRGVFLEAFKAPLLAELLGHDLDLAQVNVSVSSAGTLRGVHFADVPPGQAKYVTCVAGAVLDVIVDIRVGSPTFGRHDTVLLDDVDRRAVYLSEGLGHAFCALADGSVVAYLCSTGYDPAAEHGVNPLDPALGIEWPTTARDGTPLAYELSEKDTAAPTLEQAAATGLLPDHDAVTAYLRSRAAGD
ncbi:dTDP-6-deoxy-D-xylo-4-hexulose 3,5-epimerase [Gordonia araii NBRC 100433]|uniref:dTDP-6-deoxy-D-xylo-4-hexulose 3,5-epimerase n=1 Tax=Gordonia araii NBRC 100433 TaxID=1073574 RepID=G7GY67_9ACTN|nr:dTDP-4-dehydrorhamnose 3,5-epimerase [Gordonia araii]NNG98150.1 dTDP-4-dehydrorhamnose 3,5-epimerase family protein [Gordonia araii NBRC 100433]GAB08542.1 dTDP-6-deoxy-D-xylo-4-hexulose 3,5-epimerase [Gordonia araii NBRC 100433]